MFILPDDLFYATPEIDRLALKRKDTQWVDHHKNAKNARFLLVHGTRNFFEKTREGLQPAFLLKGQIEQLSKLLPWVYLGRSNGNDFFVIDVISIAEQEVMNLIGASFVFEDLRKAGPLEHKQRAAQLAYGRALMFWHSRHQYCGACGNQTQSVEAGHVRRCLNPKCGLEHFPRTDPAVIMLVHDGERCLLAHNNRLKPGTYSTLAGFVEPGETIEQSVRREVMEEAGVKVGDVKYAGSQPWPFPTSLMLGFYAQAKSSKITLDDDELLDAQWFSRKDLENFNDQGRFLPNRDSIARNLIEGWMKWV